MFGSRPAGRIPGAVLAVLGLLVTMGVVAGTASPAAAQASQWRVVSTGAAHTCGVKLNNTLWCWGYNLFGQLGVGDTQPRAVPTQVGSNAHWRTVTTGRYHSCALRNDGERFCWGSNSYGQLGLSGGNRLVPIRRLNEGAWDQIAAGNEHTCGIRDGDRIRCWGNNGFGQLGLGDTTNRNVPAAPSTTGGWRSVTAGAYHTCGVQHSLRWCWGNNTYGQLGLGNTNDRHVPTRRIEPEISWSTNATAISAGAFHTCAVASNGLYCWGDNSSGQLGIGSTTDWNVPRLTVSATAGVTMWLGTGYGHTCAIRANSLRYCTGDNFRGQLGIGTTTSWTTWRHRADGVTWRSIAAGGEHTCAISTANDLYCWGYGTFGQLGLGDGARRLVPTQVLG